MITQKQINNVKHIFDVATKNFVLVNKLYEDVENFDKKSRRAFDELWEYYNDEAKLTDYRCNFIEYIYMCPILKNCLAYDKSYVSDIFNFINKMIHTSDSSSYNTINFLGVISDHYTDVLNIDDVYEMWEKRQAYLAFLFRYYILLHITENLKTN